VIKTAIFPRPIKFLLNCLAAIFGTVLFEAEFWDLFHPSTPGAIYIKQIVLSATVAFLLGGFVFYRWKYGTSKWIWIVGICGFVLHAIFLRGFAPPERGYVLSLALDAVSVRLACYSLGATCVSLIVARVKAGASSTNFQWTTQN